jgi:chromate transporter
VVNLSLIVGDRYFGWRGALAALAGMLAFPLAVVLTLTVALAGLADQSMVQGALRGMGAVSAGLIAGTGFKLIAALRTNAMGVAACAVFSVATFIAIAVLRIPLIAVLLGLGVPATLWAYMCLINQAKESSP